MNYAEQKMKDGFRNKGEYDKAWYILVEEIVDLDTQLSIEQSSDDEDALTSIDYLQAQLDSKRRMLKRLDSEGVYI